MIIDEVVREFIIESLDMLEQLDQSFVALERATDDRELLTRIFRAVHTVKGTSSCLGYARLEHVAHAGESLLSRLRDGDFPATSARISVLLTMVDALHSMIAAIEATGTDEDNVDYRDLVDALEVASRADPEPGGARTAPPEPIDGFELFGTESAGGEDRADIEVPDNVAPASVDGPAHREASLPRHAPGEEAQPGGDSRLADSSVRVDVLLLDKLMNLVGELVLARNRLLQCAGTSADASLLHTSQRINLITTEIQEGVMKTRMQAIGLSWGKLPRLVRETALSCGKQVRIETEGHDTELDRTLLDALRDPLTHLIRNSVDHGIETPEVRAALGKPIEGTIRVRAYHDGGQVTVDIIDDGGGIDPKRIRAKALERGILSPREAAKLSQRDILNLIFRPAFSTADAVSHVSGRGVGMDVVRAGVEAVGGSVEVISRVGVGTTMRVRLPLTLAIIPALIVLAVDDRYAIPQASVIELLRLDERKEKSIVNINGAPVYRLRGQLLPLISFAGELGADPTPKTDVHHVVVLQSDGQQFGLIVDAVAETAEIVVKPLPTLLKGLSVYAGVTVMGDGSVCLIVDVAGLAQRAGVLHAGRHANAAAEAAAARRPLNPAQTERMLLITDAAGHPYAVPLESIARLEEFAATRIESANGAPAVNYRGEVMPIIPLSSLVGGIQTSMGRDRIRVIVYHSRSGSVGIAIDEIKDILDVELTVNKRRSRPGFRGSAIVSGRVTDVLDLGPLIAAQLPDHPAAPAA
ncbi:MAG: hypothetical protein EXR71_18505 [Myxococcales bacterium]|nr:hypothetical protein [Myxococcales bacterium]